MSNLARPLVRLTIALAMVGALATSASAQIRLKSICRVKGQEVNTLHGLGIVVGLKGTGDGGDFLPMIRSLATAMQLMGDPIGVGGATELKNAKNVALVAVQATVPAQGGLQGDLLDCTVSSIGAAKSLAGGRLFHTPLLGPNVESQQVFAFASGEIELDNVQFPTAGKIHSGCQLQEDFRNVFSRNNKITLVLNRDLADFEVSQEVAEVINGQLGSQTSDGLLARALNQLYIEVLIPDQYRNEPVEFVSQVMALTMSDPQTDARVVINERAGSIVVGGDVQIASAVVTHKNIVIETGDNAPRDPWTAVDPDQTQSSSLKSLVSALNAVKVPTEDIIDIIKGLERDGKLLGHLIIE